MTIQKESNYTQTFSVTENNSTDSLNNFTITLEGFDDNDLLVLGAKYQIALGTTPSNTLTTTKKNIVTYSMESVCLRQTILTNT